MHVGKLFKAQLINHKHNLFVKLTRPLDSAQCWNFRIDYAWPAIASYILWPTATH